MITTKTSEKVMWPIACAIVPSGMNVRRWTKTSRSAVPITISGVTSVASETARDVPAPRPRQRVSPMASATPSGTVTSTAIAASLRLWKRAERSVGVVQDGEVGVARVPAQRPALRGRAGAAVVEREADRDEDRDDRPDEVEHREEDEEARLPPRVRPPLAQTRLIPPSLRLSACRRRRRSRP